MKVRVRCEITKNKPDGNGANLGFEEKLWQTADKLRNNMDAAEYKHVVLGLIFLKYISDAFEEKNQFLIRESVLGADPEDPDEYRAENVFWVPKEARWEHLKKNAKQQSGKSPPHIMHGAGRAGSMRMWLDSAWRSSWMRSGSMDIS